MPPKKVTPRGQSAPPPSHDDTPPTPPKRTRKPRAKKPEEGLKQYIRNIRNIQCRLTLSNGRRIELQPRGQRDDAAVIFPEEVDDVRLLDNHGWLFQYISEETYRDVINKQSVNSTLPTLVSQLRDEYGNPYQQAEVQTSLPFEQQGVVVARSQEAAPRTVYQETAEQLQRTGPVGPQQVQVPGSVGHPLSVPTDQQRANRQIGQAEKNLIPDADQLRQNLR